MANQNDIDEPAGLNDLREPDDARDLDDLKLPRPKLQMKLRERLWAYQAERFPLKQTVPLLAVFSASSVVVSAELAGRAIPGPLAFLTAFLLAFTLFFQMRVADEIKDAKTDRQYRPERPIPRGIISLWFLTMIGLTSMGLTLLVAWMWGPAQIMLLGIAWAYLALMTIEFGRPRWLRARPLWYLISHMMIMPLIDLMLTGVEWAGNGGPAPGLVIFLALSFVNGCVLEIGRKIWAPSEEREGVDSYSKLWGPARAVWIWLGCVGAAAVLLVALGLVTGTVWWMGVIALGGVGAVASVAVRFRANPLYRTQQAVDLAAGLWVFVCYLVAALVPLLFGP